MNDSNISENVDIESGGEDGEQEMSVKCDRCDEIITGNENANNHLDDCDTFAVLAKEMREDKLSIEEQKAIEKELEKQKQKKELEKQKKKKEAIEIEAEKKRIKDLHTMFKDYASNNTNEDRSSVMRKRSSSVFSSASSSSFSSAGPSSSSGYRSRSTSSDSYSSVDISASPKKFEEKQENEDKPSRKPENEEDNNEDKPPQKQRGRPKGSKNKPKKTRDSEDKPPKKKPGRPKGSRNKLKN